MTSAFSRVLRCVVAIETLSRTTLVRRFCSIRGVSVVRPRGFLHGLEFVEGLEAEFNHPLGIPFLLRDDIRVRSSMFNNDGFHDHGGFDNRGG